MLSRRNLEGGRRQAHGLYSGWYNGLAKKHFFHPSRGVRLEHEVIVHCKASPDIRVIDAIAVILKDERVARGIEMK